MNDNLIEMLLHLFEQSLTELHEDYQVIDNETQEANDAEELMTSVKTELFIKAAHPQSTRVFTDEEQLKLTKASYQFLMKMKLSNLVNSQHFETILEKLQNSDSRFVTLQETKWTIRNVLAQHLSEEQLSLLDVILYPPKQDITLH